MGVGLTVGQIEVGVYVFRQYLGPTYARDFVAGRAPSRAGQEETPPSDGRNGVVFSVD